MSTSRQFERKRLHSVDPATPTQSLLKPSRPFASLPPAVAQQVPPAPIEQLNRRARLGYSIATLPLFPPIQRTSDHPSPPEEEKHLQSRIQAARSGGQPLDRKTQQRLEQGLGTETGSDSVSAALPGKGIPSSKHGAIIQRKRLFDEMPYTNRATAITYDFGQGQGIHATVFKDEPKYAAQLGYRFISDRWVSTYHITDENTQARIFYDDQGGVIRQDRNTQRLVAYGRQYQNEVDQQAKYYDDANAQQVDVQLAQQEAAEQQARQAATEKILNERVDKLIRRIMDEQAKNLLSEPEIDALWPKFSKASREAGGPDDTEFPRSSFVARYKVLQQERNEQQKQERKEKARLVNSIILGLIDQDNRANLSDAEIEQKWPQFEAEYKAAGGQDFTKEDFVRRYRNLMVQKQAQKRVPGAEVEEETKKQKT